MKTIWKYKLETKDSQTIDMPKHAKILTAHVQGNDICIWAIVETNNSFVPRIIEVFGTGHHMPEHRRKYISSVLMFNGNLVFHLFERIA